MTAVYVDAPSGNSNLRMLLSSGALFLRADTGALEAFDDVADYRIAASSSVLLGTGLSRYTFTVVTPAVLPVVLNGIVYDITTGEIFGAFVLDLDGNGDEIDAAAIARRLYAALVGDSTRDDDQGVEQYFDADGNLAFTSTIDQETGSRVVTFP